MFSLREGGSAYARRFAGRNTGAARRAASAAPTPVPKWVPHPHLARRRHTCGRVLGYGSQQSVRVSVFSIQYSVTRARGGGIVLRPFLIFRSALQTPPRRNYRHQIVYTAFPIDSLSKTPFRDVHKTGPEVPETRSNRLQDGIPGTQLGTPRNSLRSRFQASSEGLENGIRNGPRTRFRGPRAGSP